MNETTRKTPHGPAGSPTGIDRRRNSQPTSGNERRRIAQVVHDERGNASVSWRDAPTNHERPVLEVLGNAGLAVKHEETYDPYARREARRGGGQTTRTDLRKLSEWIKMMRELEARKRSGDAES